MITVLSFYDRIALYHTLAPWILGLHRSAGTDVEVPSLHFTNNPHWCLTRDRNEVLIMVRQFLKPPVVDQDLLRRLRERYRRIVFLNGNAGGGLHRPEVLPFVDRFYNKALFSERSAYAQSLYGGELFSQFNHEVFGVVDPEPHVSAPPAPENYRKLAVHWNIGVGAFPRRRLAQRFGVALARSPFFDVRVARLALAAGPMLRPPATSPLAENAYRYDVNARLGRPGYPSIAHHRHHLVGVLEAAAGRAGWEVARDMVPPRRYFSDLRRSRVTFSPFGWGELCFRDFEAIRAGSLLIKPDMSHLETWPQVFLPHETYAPVRWDGTDLADTIQYYLDHPSERRRVVRQAQEHLRQQLDELPARAMQVLRDAVGAA